MTRLIEADAQLVREALEERLWPEWAAAVIERSPDASRRLDVIRAVGGALAAHAADRLTAETVAAIDRAADPHARVTAAHGFTTYASARRLYADDRFAEARPQFEKSHRELIEAGSPFAVMAAFHQGLTLYYERQIDAAVQRVDEAIATAREHEYSALLGRALWVRGLIRPMPMGVTQRLNNYQDAMAAFTRAREAAHVAMVHVLLAETHQFFGDLPTAWMHRRQSLADFDRVRDRRRRHSTLIEAARAATQQKLPETAAHFARAALDAAVPWQHPVALAESYRESARAALDMQQLDRAAADIDRARQSLAKIPDAGMLARLAPFVQTTSAEVEVARDPQRARSLIADASRMQREAGRGQYLSRLALLSAQAWLVEGRPAEAIADLQAGIEEIEVQRDAIVEPRLRQTYLSESWLLHKAMIELQVTQQRTDAALEFAERGRARALLERSGGEVRAPLGASAIRRQMPDGVAALVYVVLDTRILAWALRRDGGTFAVLPISRALTRTLVQGLRHAIETNDAAAADRFAATLHGLLVQPLAGALRDGDRLVIVPDDLLNEIAWNILRSADTQNPYLAARHPITLAPSVSAFLSLRSRAAQPMRPGRAMVVTTTDFQSALPPLMFARREAQSLASLYPGLTSIDAAKTPRTLLSQLFTSSEMIHLALHAFPGTPAFEPHFVLAGGSKPLSERLLTASDIEAMTLPNTRLVVLAACSTARGPVSQADGPFSLASAFLSAGVPAALATQWDVDDRATAELLTRFHAHLAHTGSPLLALQAAQGELRGHADRVLREPRNWASFVLIGAF
jgi:CHAT domain-containing protein